MKPVSWSPDVAIANPGEIYCRCIGQINVCSTCTAQPSMVVAERLTSQDPGPGIKMVWVPPGHCCFPIRSLDRQNSSSRLATENFPLVVLLNCTISSPVCGYTGGVGSKCRGGNKTIVHGILVGGETATRRGIIQPDLYAPTGTSEAAGS